MSSVIIRKRANLNSSVEVVPVLAEMMVQAGGSPEAFCQAALLAQWQLNSVIHNVHAGALRWHGHIESRHDGLRFCSRLKVKTGNSMPQPDKIVAFFGIGIITNSVYKGRVWEISCDLPLAEVQSLRSRCGGSSVSDELSEMLTVLDELRWDMTGMNQEMLMTNQRVMAMVEEMGVWNGRDGSRHEISQLLVEHLESNRQLIERQREKGSALDQAELGVFFYLTKRVMEQERALQQTERLATVGRLVAGVAHEINNPLTFIKMNAELLALKLDRYFEQDAVSYINEAQYKHPIEAIIRGVERIANIVSGLKFFSRQEQMEKAGVPLAKCLEEAWVLVSSNIELSCAVEMKAAIGADVMIYGNAQQLEQVVINLLHNALKAVHKARPQQGNISVSAYQETGEKEWVVIMADNGCGITESALSKIFEPFYTSDDETGTGLGLSIVQGIIQEHGGNIAVMSVVGQGTTFTIRLPSWRLQEGDK